MKTFIRYLTIALKYAVYLVAIVEILQFAKDKLSNVPDPMAEPGPGDVVNNFPHE